MMNAPTIVTIRPGVQFTPPAAASWLRAEAGWGRRIPTNSTYRDWDRQMSMHLAWQAYANGRGPHPGHARAVHPKYSKHTTGLAADTDWWTRPGFNEHMAEHGWIRVAASDPTERHHFEYQERRDKHRNDPTPAGAPTEEDEEDEELPMNVKLYLHKPTNKLLLVDHLNMRIRDLGSDNNLERRKFDKLPYTTVSGADWTAMFTAWPYVEREKAIRMVSV